MPGVCATLHKLGASRIASPDNASTKNTNFNKQWNHHLENQRRRNMQDMGLGEVSSLSLQLQCCCLSLLERPKNQIRSSRDQGSCWMSSPVAVSTEKWFLYHELNYRDSFLPYLATWELVEPPQMLSKPHVTCKPPSASFIKPSSDLTSRRVTR